MCFSFQTAIFEDVDEILQLIQNRIQWMDENDINQWNKTNYLIHYPRSYYEDLVSKGLLFVYKSTDPSQVLGAVALFKQDQYWEDDSTSLYIHNLVTDLATPGIGATILDFCEQLARQQGKKYLRLDCQASNVRLNEYYSRHGFKAVEALTDGHYSGLKRQKMLE